MEDAFARLGRLRVAPPPPRYTSCFSVYEYGRERKRCDEVMGRREKFDPFDWLPGREGTSNNPERPASRARFSHLLPPHAAPIVLPARVPLQTPVPNKTLLPYNSKAPDPAGPTNQSPNDIDGLPWQDHLRLLRDWRFYFLPSVLLLVGLCVRYIGWEPFLWHLVPEPVLRLLGPRFAAIKLTVCALLLLWWGSLGGYFAFWGRLNLEFWLRRPLGEA